MNGKILKKEVRLVVVCCLVVFLWGAAGCINFVKYEKERVDQDLTGANRGYILGQAPPVQESREPKIMTFYKIDITFPPEPEDIRSAPKHDRELYGNRGYIVGGPIQAVLPPQPAPTKVVPAIEKDKSQKESKSQSEEVKKVSPEIKDLTPGKETKPRMKKSEELEKSLPKTEKPALLSVEEKRKEEQTSPKGQSKAAKPSVSSSIKLKPVTTEKIKQKKESKITRLQVPSGKSQSIKPVTKYTVKVGDTLEKVAAEVYKDKNKWPLIYEANRDKIKTPDKIYPGQILTIPRD